MTCKTAASLTEALLDGELDASQAADVERHISECSACSAIRDRLEQLRSDLRAPELRYAASERLRSRVTSGLRDASAGKPAAAPVGWRMRSWAIAATVLLAASLGWNLMLLRSQKNAGDAVAQEIVSSHVRSLIGDHLLDVQSTDQHNVKPWFNGKLDYSPDVRDFAADGFPLIGGRIDYVDHRPVAVLVYKRRQHSINLFVWPSGGKLVAPENVNGFNLATWNRDGMNYCAVSDLNAGELREFAAGYAK